MKSFELDLFWCDKYPPINFSAGMVYMAIPTCLKLFSLTNV